MGPKLEIKKKLRNVKICRFFLNFNITLTLDMQMLSIWIFFTQALCWKYHSKPENLVVIQFMKYPNFEFKHWKKHKKCQNLEGFFQILAHDDYEQTNSTQLKFFLHKPYDGNTTAGWRFITFISFITYPNFDFKIWKKKTKKCENLEFYECWG